MAYTGHSDYASAEPATFVVVGEEDGIAPPAVMERRVQALRRSGTGVEYREYQRLGHGFGLGSARAPRDGSRGHSLLGDLDGRAVLGAEVTPPGHLARVS